MIRRVLQVLTASVLIGLLIAAFSARVGASETVTDDAFTEGGLKIQIDGIDVQFDPAPYILPPGRTMVPMRAFFEAMGAVVEWDPATRAVTAKRGAQVIELRIGNKIAYINGVAYALTVAPEIRRDRAFIPLRFVAQSLDSTVNYHPTRREISIWSKAQEVPTIHLAPDSQLKFRYMLVDLFLTSRLSILITAMDDFPGPVTYTSEGMPSGAKALPITRSLIGLDLSRRFYPPEVMAHETATAPWLSEKVFQDLRETGRSLFFQVGGFHENGQFLTTLTVLRNTRFAVTLNGSRVSVPVLQVASTTGDQFWILDDPTNPLVLKFEPVGLAMPGYYGTVGYQIESITNK